MSQLHYLYEQQETGKERFVYYCTSCNCVLGIRRQFGPAGEMADFLNRLCPGCGRPLIGSVECRLAPIPPEWSESSGPAPTVGKRNPLFQQASSLPHFSLGFPRLDFMLRPLSPDHLVVISGGASPMVAELAAFRAQLPIESGGLDSSVLFIDGGNRSDPYLFSSFARQNRLKPATAMRRVATCRVFTFYQLADLVSQHLVRATQDYGTRLVIISDLLGTFNEPELEEREARRVLGAVGDGIKQVKRSALVLVTLASPNKYDDIVVSWADAIVQLSSVRGATQAELLKHWSRPPAISSFKLDQLLKAVR